VTRAQRSAALVAALLCVASTPIGRSSRSAARCDDVAPIETGTYDRTITSGGVERHFLLTIPEAYDGTQPFALVLGLHALTVDYHVVAPLSGFADMAERYDFITVAPSGRISTVPYWLAAPTRDNYDIAFLGDLLDRLESELCIDRARVFSTGISNGGQMSSLLACQLAGRVAAVAPVAGAEFYDTCRGRPVAVMAFHGTADPIVTYEGGGLNARRISDQNFWHGDIPPDVPVHRGVDAAMRSWAEHNGCRRRSVEKRISPEVRRRTWRGCDAPTILYIVDGGGHSLPGRPVPGFEDQFGPTTTDIDATALMFDFFFARP
jgi:polyhydroxybutyrate depolymerase